MMVRTSDQSGKMGVGWEGRMRLVTPAGMECHFVFNLDAKGAMLVVLVSLG